MSAQVAQDTITRHDLAGLPKAAGLDKAGAQAVDLSPLRASRQGLSSPDKISSHLSSTVEHRFRKAVPKNRKPRNSKDLRPTPADRAAHLQRAENRPQSTPGMPPDLAEVAAAWPHLSEAVKAGILAMVRASAGP